VRNTRADSTFASPDNVHVRRNDRRPTGALSDQAQEVHAFIRGKLAGLDQTVADKVQILYGGSVKGSNAAELFTMQDIDGGLIGGASLDADDFLAICKAGS